MVVVDRDMRISNGNEQLAKLTEVPKKILIGSRFASYFTDPARATAAIEKTLADGAVTNYDLVLRTAAGSEILVSFNASVSSRAGAVSGISEWRATLQSSAQSSANSPSNATTAAAWSNPRPTLC